MHGVVDAFGEAVREFLHLVLDALLQSEGVRAGHLIDRQHHGRIFTEECRGRVLQRPQLDARDIAQPHHGPGARIRAHDDVAKLGGIT